MVLRKVGPANSRSLYAKWPVYYWNTGMIMFNDCTSESIQPAVMEKTPNGSMVPMDAGWSALSNWSALRELKTKDARCRKEVFKPCDEIDRLDKLIYINMEIIEEQ